MIDATDTYSGESPATDVPETDIESATNTNVYETEDDNIFLLKTVCAEYC